MGSLSSFGSGVFCDYFLKMWTADGFPNYNAVAPPSVVTGQSVLSRILEDKFSAGAMDDASKGDKHGHNHKSNASAGGSVGMGSAEDDSLFVQEGEGVNPYLRDFPGTPDDPVVLHGFVIAALFRTRPELAELVALKLQEMQVHDEEIQ